MGSGNIGKTIGGEHISKENYVCHSSEVQHGINTKEKPELLRTTRASGTFTTSKARKGYDLDTTRHESCQWKSSNPPSHSISRFQVSQDQAEARDNVLFGASPPAQR